MGRFLILLGLAGLAAGSTPAEATPPLGCHPLLTLPGDVEPRPIVVVDDQVLRVGDDQVFRGIYEDVDLALVHSAEVLCWSPKTRKYEQGGIPVIQVITKASVQTARERLEQLLEAQTEFFERHSVYAESFEELGFEQSATPVEMTATRSGWSATMPGTRGPARCHVVKGDAALWPPAIERGVVECRADTSVVLPAIGTFYDEWVASGR